MANPYPNLSRWPASCGRQAVGNAGASIVIEDLRALGGHVVTFNLRLDDHLNSNVASEYRLPESSISRSSFARESELLENTQRHTIVKTSYGITNDNFGELGRGVIVEWETLSVHRLIGKLSSECFVPIFRDLPECFQHVHSYGLIHRHATPENIVFTPFEPRTAKQAD